MLRITSQRARFANVMQKLPSDMMDEISDVLSDLREHEPYDHLKEAILKRTGRSEEDMIQEILRNVTRGDKTPSQLLRYMRNQLGKHNVSEKAKHERYEPSKTERALADLQRLIDEVLRGLLHVYAYIDDILVASTDADSHRQHLRETFSKPTSPFVEELRHKMARLKYATPRQQPVNSYIPQHLRDYQIRFRTERRRETTTHAGIPRSFSGSSTHRQAPYDQARQLDRHHRNRSDQACFSGEATRTHQTQHRRHQTTPQRLLCGRPDPVGGSLSLKTFVNIIIIN
ncbi:unnamed protein product [Acanthosepion pharaonis]|uniref:DUF7041 domain-containing protein n=1 Tax=Acanthosepion pharaonis TaxID=158019 RepID=A0A812DE71_ACAPH|nr:unnamed protein product [Sepia pharaonis]